MSGVEYLGLTANQLAKAADNLKAENAKLRERVNTLEWLLKLTLKYAEEGELSGYELCDLCDRLGACENHPATSCTRTFDTSSDFIRERMHELGVSEWTP